MTKQDQKEFEKFIQKVIDKYKPILGLSNHIFHILKEMEHEDATMETEVRFPYLDVYMAYSEKSFEKWKKKEDMEQYVVHEMSHALTEPLFRRAIQRYTTPDEIEFANETLVDMISMIAIKQQRIIDKR